MNRLSVWSRPNLVCITFIRLRFGILAVWRFDIFVQLHADTSGNTNILPSCMNEVNSCMYPLQYVSPMQSNVYFINPTNREKE